MRHYLGASQRLKMQMLVGTAFGFLLVVMIGVASADETPSSDPALPVELASAVVVAAGANSLDTTAVGPLSAETGGVVQRGTAFQLDDGRIGTVAHALIDARTAKVAGTDLDVNTATISREHDVASIAGEVLPRALTPAQAPAQIGETVAIGGIPVNGRIEVITGEIIDRTSGRYYGIGRPDIYVISAEVDVGWSGGPVVNSAGEVIAIIVGVETKSGATLAVPIEHLPR